MVASQQEEVLWIFDLVRQQQADSLQRLLATVDVVAQEQVVGLRRKATVLEQSQQVVILSVDVTCVCVGIVIIIIINNRTEGVASSAPAQLTADLQRRLQLQVDGLRQENLSRLQT